MNILILWNDYISCEFILFDDVDNGVKWIYLLTYGLMPASERKRTSRMSENPLYCGQLEKIIDKWNWRKKSKYEESLCELVLEIQFEDKHMEKMKK